MQLEGKKIMILFSLSLDFILDVYIYDSIFIYISALIKCNISLCI